MQVVLQAPERLFTSVEVLKIHLANQAKGSPPVIVAAQTNHAPGPLASGVVRLDAGAQIVRVGGRTESERIAAYTMFNVRRKAWPQG